MPTFTRFEDIEAWQKARLLTRRMYEVAAAGSFARDFGLRDQAQRASTSIMGNIAERFGRNGRKEFQQFLSVAKGSTAELQSHLYVAVDQRYIDHVVFDELYGDADRISRMLNGLMTYLRSTPVQGVKFARGGPTLNSKPQTPNSKP